MSHTHPHTGVPQFTFNTNSCLFVEFKGLVNPNTYTFTDPVPTSLGGL